MLTQESVERADHADGLERAMRWTGREAFAAQLSERAVPEPPDPSHVRARILPVAQRAVVEAGKVAAQRVAVR
eukprot:6962887-Prymnesium_polylepis.3